MNMSIIRLRVVLNRISSLICILILLNWLPKTEKKSSRIKLIQFNSKSSTGNQFLSKALYSIRIEMKYRVRNLCESIPLKKIKSNQIYAISLPVFLGEMTCKGEDILVQQVDFEFRK